MGVAYVRPAAGHGRGAPGGLGADAGPRQRRDLRSCARPRGLHQGARRRHGRQAARAREPPRASSSGCRSPSPTYPLRVEGVRQAIAALGAEVPPLQRDEYTLEQLLDEVVGPSPQLMAIAVHKHRVHYVVDGCMTERTEVRTDCGTATTIAAESEDPTRVVATVLALGLELQPQRQPAARAQDFGGVRRAPLRRHRRRHELGEVPPRRAARRRRAGGQSTTARRSPGSAKASTRRDGCRTSRSDAPSRRSPRWRPRRRAPAQRTSPRSALPGCGWRQTATCSWTRCARSAASR